MAIYHTEDMISLLCFDSHYYQFMISMQKQFVIAVIPLHIKKEDIYNTLIPGQAFKVKLKHTAINDKTYKKRRKMKTNENIAFNSIET